MPHNAPAKDRNAELLAMFAPSPAERLVVDEEKSDGGSEFRARRAESGFELRWTPGGGPGFHHGEPGAVPGR